MHNFIASIRGNRLKAFLAFSIFSTIFIWFTYPLVLNFENAYTISNIANSDTHQYFWNIFNFEKCIASDKNPFTTDLLFSPFGSSLIMHTYTPSMSIFALPYKNNFLAMNLFLFLNFAFSGFGTYLLCRHFNSNFLLAVLAGIVYGFSPYKMLRLTEHYHLLLTGAVPFFVLFFLKTFSFSTKRFFPDVSSSKYFFLCIICGLKIVLSDYYSAFSVLYFCFFYAIYYGFVSGINYRSTPFWIFFVGIILSSHIILHQFKVIGVDNKGGIWWSGDILAYFIPPKNSMFFDFSFFRQIENTIYHYPQSVEYCMFTGFAVLALVVISFLISLKINFDLKLKPFLFISLMFFLMTVPDLKFAGKSILNTPLSFFHYIPFLNNLRSPTRMFPMVTLAVLPFVSAVLSNALKYFKLKNIVWLLLIIITLFEYKPKNYTLCKQNKVPAMIKFLAQKPQGALLNIPFGIRDGFVEKGSFETIKLFYQTIHQKPMTDGYISRLNHNLIKKFDTNFYNSLLILQSKKTTSMPIEKLPDNIRYILIERQYCPTFEHYFDNILIHCKTKKFNTSDYLLYQIY